MSRQCTVVRCAELASGFSTHCDSHKRTLRRHGHPEQKGVTVFELQPFIDRVVARRLKNPGRIDPPEVAPLSRAARPLHRDKESGLIDCEEVEDLTDHDSLLEAPAVCPRPHLSPTERQRDTRALFDLDAALAALPGGSHWTSRQGAAGVRPRHDLVANISDDLLREAAAYSLKAQRCSEDYLGALRIVLANQADADRRGYVLEVNQRNGFAPPRVIRTIINQMQANGISWGQPVWVGPGRSSTVQCLGRDPTEAPEGGRSRDLQTMYRLIEDCDDRRRERAEARGDFPKSLHPCPFVGDAEIPY